MAGFAEFASVFRAGYSTLLKRVTERGEIGDNLLQLISVEAAWRGAAPAAGESCV